MAQDHAASVQGVCIRATALASDGAPASGAHASYAMDAFISVTFTPNYDEGDEISEKAASGLLCVYYKALDTLKNVTLSISICEPDVEFTEILCGGTLLAVTTGTSTAINTGAAVAIGDTSMQLAANSGTGAFTVGTSTGAETVVVTGVTGSAAPYTAYVQFPFTKVHAAAATVVPVSENIGYAAPAFGTTGNPNGVGIEVWSYAVSNARRASNMPFYRWVLPECQLRPDGDRVIENGLMANAFAGTGVGNPFFSPGPAGDWPFPSDRAYQYARDTAAPSGINGYVAVT